MGVVEELNFLRLAEEPCRYFDEERIHRLLMEHIDLLMDTLERLYAAWAADDSLITQPKKLVFSNDGLAGDWRVMPCMIDGFDGDIIKAVKVIGTNEEEVVVRDKICVGKALLIDKTDNFVKAIFDVCALSSFRTAAISALAFKHSVSIDQPRVGIIGAGRIGFYTARILNRWLGINAFWLHDANPDRAAGFNAVFGPELTIHTTDLETICNSCSALFLATDSPNAVLNAHHTKGLSFISSVGADADNLSELDADMVTGRRLISESRQNIAFGDMHRWQAAGLIEEADITPLCDLMAQPPADDGQPVLFISTGTAVQDALTCHCLYTIAGADDA